MFDTPLSPSLILGVPKAPRLKTLVVHACSVTSLEGLPHSLPLLTTVSTHINHIAAILPSLPSFRMHHNSSIDSIVLLVSTIHPPSPLAPLSAFIAQSFIKRIEGFRIGECMGPTHSPPVARPLIEPIERGDPLHFDHHHPPLTHADLPSAELHHIPRRHRECVVPSLTRSIQS